MTEQERLQQLVPNEDWADLSEFISYLANLDSIAVADIYSANVSIEINLFYEQMLQTIQLANRLIACKWSDDAPERLIKAAEYLRSAKLERVVSSPLVVPSDQIIRQLTIRDFQQLHA